MNFALGFPPVSSFRRVAVLFVALLLLPTRPLWAATYNAGPGQTYTNLGSVPWGALAPGDTVNIHYQAGGYHEVILLSKSGAAGSPITINGIPDSGTGALPVIDGQNAVASTNIAWKSSSQNTEGVVVVGLSAGQKIGYIPSWIVIQNLQVRNADIADTVKRSDGSSHVFNTTAAAIYAEYAQHLTVQGCDLNNSANGFYCGTQNGDANELSAVVLVQNCWIHDNGDPNNYDAGNIHSESKGIVIQYNLIGPMRAGAVGDQIKDRSSGTVLAYNQIINGPGTGTAFWFTQTGGGAGVIDADPAYRTNFVYGNIFFVPTNSAGGEQFRYDTLNIYGPPRNGTLYFYNNTVVNYGSQSQRYGYSLFALPVESEVTQFHLHDVLDCRNNIFANIPPTANGTPPLMTFLNSDASTVNFGTNWISPGFQYFQLPYLSNTFFGSFTGTNQLLIGKNGAYNPGFSNVGTTNFQLLSSSPAIDRAGPQAPAVLASPFNVTYQYVNPANFQVRTVNGLGLDLGALEGTSTNIHGALYTLTVSNGFGGGQYPAGAAIPIAASNAPPGQLFAGWVGAGVPNPSSMGNLFVMPAGNRVVTATFTNAIVISNYLLTVAGGTGGGSYLPGTVVSITAASPPAGKFFAGWTGFPVASSNAASTTLTMPASPVTVTANYQAVPTYTLTVVGGSGAGSYLPGKVVTITAANPPAGKVFAGWSGFAVANSNAASTTLTMPASPVTITANYRSVATYTLSVVNGSGSGAYAAGAVVPITANPPPAQTAFADWSGYAVANALASQTTVTMPAQNVAITANYLPPTIGGGGGPTNPPAGTGPTNAILFVTQVRIPYDFTTIASTFGNQSGSLLACGRGGDLYIRYPDGSLKNLTRAAGYGQWGAQAPNGIAVRQPTVHWSGKKALFSMVVGASTNPYAITTHYWQIYEITNFTSPGAVPVVTLVPNQPANYNNVAPIYGSDDRIIFASDRPRNGQAQLYPQLDEYEEQPTVTGLWSLQPSTGDLFMINHTPSGAFSPLLDSAGRVVFSRWDHLQRDQQADTDWEHGSITYGVFNWSDESSTSVPTTSLTELFPEPRSVRTDLLAGTGLAGLTFNQFFPWAINQDGTDEETLNHIGRHEIGGSYGTAAFTNDPNIYDLYDFEANYNTNRISNFLEPKEDPNVHGLFYGIDAPEFGSHGAGQIVSITGNTNINAYYMRVDYLTPRSTADLAASASTIPPDHTGLYRNPLMTSDGFFIASHTANTLPETGGDVVFYPATNYLNSSFDFRLKFLQFSNGFYVPGSPLTPGMTNHALYMNPQAGTLELQTNFLWELDPVEVMARTIPPPSSTPIAAPELAAFAQAGVDVGTFQNYLTTHQLALIVSRDVTTRDHADHQQPYNLRVAGTAHETIGAPGKIYDVAWLQLFQADQLRGLNQGHTNNPGYGRRVLAQYMHDPAVDNPPVTGAPTGSVAVAPDGSQAAFVPARRAMSWQLTDTNGVGVVRERYWLTFAPGEIRTCTSCHGINQETQADTLVPTNTPQALVSLLNFWKTNLTITPQLATPHSAGGASSAAIRQDSALAQSADAAGDAPYFEVSFTYRPEETGVTYHVQATSDFITWTDIASYTGTNSVLAPEAMEVSRTGSPNTTVTVRDLNGVKAVTTRFLRVKVTRP